MKVREMVSGGYKWRILYPWDVEVDKIRTAFLFPFL